MGDDKQFNVDKTTKMKDMVEPRYICQRLQHARARLTAGVTRSENNNGEDDEDDEADNGKYVHKEDDDADSRGHMVDVIDPDAVDFTPFLINQSGRPSTTTTNRTCSPNITKSFVAKRWTWKICLIPNNQTTTHRRIRASIRPKNNISRNTSSSTRTPAISMHSKLWDAQTTLPGKLK
ncbi:hypothetical protein MHU86_21279 [Fragilaria crotonensis]|nr:hypothetical protein MHU86_21279 [Fragilaria crotonensis]